MLFTLTVLSAFLVFNFFLIFEGDYRANSIRVGGAVTLILWLFSVLDVFRRTSPRRLRRIEEEKAVLLREGMIAYLRGQLEAAEHSFRACLRLDNQEVEALVRLGIVAARLGWNHRARRTLRRARALDLEEKWRWEIERELQAVRKKPEGIARDRASPDSVAASKLERGQGGGSGERAPGLGVDTRRDVQPGPPTLAPPGQESEGRKEHSSSI